MAHLMGKIFPLARRVVGHRANNATTSKGEIFPTEGRLSPDFGRRCDHLMVLQRHIDDRA